MDLSRTRLVLRERALLDVLDLALRFVVRHGGIYAKTALVVLPGFVLASELLGRFAGPYAAWSFALATTAFAGTPFTLLASRLVFEDDVRVRGAIGDAFRASGQVFLLRVLAIVGGVIGFVFFVVPGVWLSTLLFFVVEVTVLERAKLGVALARSAVIAQRQSGEALLALLLLGSLEVVMPLLSDWGGRVLVSAIFESRPPAPIWDAGWSSLSLLGFWLFVPYLSTARFFVYLDIRTRSEGWDIQTRFTAIATEPAATALPSRPRPSANVATSPVQGAA